MKSLLQQSGDTPEAEPRIEILLLDMLTKMEYFAHLSVEQAITAAVRLNAKRTIFIGMGHSLEHQAMVAMLQERGLAGRMEMGFDGLVIDFPETRRSQC